MFLCCKLAFLVGEHFFGSLDVMSVHKNFLINIFVNVNKPLSVKCNFPWFDEVH